MKEYKHYLKKFGVTISAVVTKRQKDILAILDERLQNEKKGYVGVSEEKFYIEYADGSSYTRTEDDEEGVYKKKGISKILYDNAFDTMIYGGGYEVNEDGVVTLK